MDIAAFFTMQQNLNQGTSQNANGAHGENNPALSNFGFMETMIERLIEARQNQEAGIDGNIVKNPEQEALSSDNPTLSPDTTVSTLETLGQTSNEAAQIIDISGISNNEHQDFLAKLNQTLSQNQDAFDNILQPFENILTVEAIDALKAGEELPTTTDIFLPGVTMKDLKDTSFNVLIEQGIKAILVNLTPEQITQAQENLKSAAATNSNGEIKSTEEINEDIFAAFGFLLIKMLPPQARPDATAQSNGGIIVTSNNHDDGINSIRDLVSQMSALLQRQIDTGNINNTGAGINSPVSEAKKAATAAITAIATASSQAQNMGANDQIRASNNDGDSDKGEEFQWGSDFKAFADTFKGLISNNGNERSTEHLAMKAANGATNALAKGTLDGADGQLSALKGWPFSMDGSLLESLGWGDPSIDDIGAAATSSYTSGNLNGLTNISAFASSAANAHPGTALVAASMSKTAASGETKSITLQLDPPELGRVQVKMEFGENKNVKAMITVEKPETLAMLQRDIANLERALQEAGMEVGDGALDFELAEDGSFSSDGGHDGTGGNGDGIDGEDEMEIIDTTMTWVVDPNTGHTSYNIIA